jgi:hypothetical protein
MNCKRILVPVVLAAAIAAAPLFAARAQIAAYPYYYNPLFWPFLAAGAVLGTAALIVTAPVRVVCTDCLPPPYAFYPFYTAPPAPQPVAYPAPPPPGQPGITYSYGPR